MSNLTAFNQTLTNTKTQDYLASVLGEKKATFVANITSLVANDKNLQECEPVTLLYAGINATALDLPLNKNLGFAYVIPYKNNKEGKTEAQFQIGYKGLVQLAIRSGQFSTINVTEVREGEVENFDLLTGEITFKARADRQSLPIIGYVAYFKLTNGFAKMLYMTKEEVEAHGLRYSQTFASKNDYVKKSSKWTTDFDAMAKKTVLKLLLNRYAPLSIEMQKAVETDQAVIRTEDGTPHYVDNEVEEAQEAQVEEINEATVLRDVLKSKSEDDLKALIDSAPQELIETERVMDAIAKKRESFR